MRWEEVHYEVVEPADERLWRFVAAVRESYANGGAVLKCFRPKKRETFDAASQSDLRGLDHLLGTFLHERTVRDGLSDIKIGTASGAVPAYSATGVFEFEGHLTQILLCGGAYKRAVTTEDQARRLSRDFVDAILGDHRLQCRVFSIRGAWTEWFNDVAWDTSFVVFDLVSAHWWVLCMTDTD